MSNTPFFRHFDHLPDSDLRQASGVHFFRLLDVYLLPLNQCSLHRYQDGALVRYLVDGLGHDGIKDGDVPSPELAQVVAFPVSNRAFFECRGESCSQHLVVDLGQLPVQVSSDDYLGLRILPDDALH